MTHDSYPMTTLKLYDPPLCCSSGVCGPSVDPVLVRVNADLQWLKSRGVAVERYNLAQQPADFATNPLVRERLQAKGENALPLAFVDDELVAARFYPTRDQFARLLGLDTEDTEPACDSEGCCG